MTTVEDLPDGQFGKFEFDPAAVSPRVLGEALMTAINATDDAAGSRPLDWSQFRVWPDGTGTRFHVPYATAEES